MINFFFHRGDNDGWAARWIAHHIKKSVSPSNLTALGKQIKEEPRINFMPYEYGDKYPGISVGGGEKITTLFVDISLPEEQMEHVLAHSNSVIVVDHHATQKDMYQRLLQKFPDKFTLVYYEGRCGAYLFWQQCFFAKPIQLIEYIDDHDRWVNELPYSKEIRAYLLTLSQDMIYWDKIAGCDLVSGSAVEKGYAIQRFIQQQIEAALPKAQLFYLPVGEDVFVTAHALPNCIKGITSELGHALAAQSSSGIGCIYFPTEDGKWVYSLRGSKGVIVNEIAKFNGGGGHPSAARFATPIGPENFMREG